MRNSWCRSSLVTDTEAIVCFASLVYLEGLAAVRTTHGCAVALQGISRQKIVGYP